MKKTSIQKVVWSNLPMMASDYDNINRELNEGYEVVDIIPYMVERGGAIFGFRRGLFTGNLLFHLAASKNKTKIDCLYVQRQGSLDYVDKMNEIIKGKQESGGEIKKIIPGMVVLEPQEGRDLGTGTRGFFLIFADMIHPNNTKIHIAMRHK